MLSVRVFAQNTADSIYFYQQSKADVKTVQQNATFLLSNDIQKLGLATINFDFAKGGFKKAQQAEKNIDTYIYSEGINAFGRFKASGYFSFKRTWQDSLAWTTKGLEQDDQPYYYASSKAGKYERINYNLGGILSYNLIKNKLYLATGIDYAYNSTTRSVDPRPQVNTFWLKLNPEVSYKFNEHNILGISSKYGYGNEVTSLTYKNTDFALSLGYPDRINYLVQGYGLINISQGSRSFERVDKYFGLGINHSLKFNDFKLNTALNYDFTKEGSFQQLSASILRVYMGYYYTDKISLVTELIKSTVNHNTSLRFSYSKQNSNDANFMLYAVNYRYYNDNASLQILSHRHKNQKLSFETGIKALYNKVDRRDLSTAHLYNYSTLAPHLIYNLYYVPNKKEKMYAGVELGGQQAFNAHISVPTTQISVFTNGVFFPDYTYHTSSYLKLQGNLSYISSTLFKQFKTGFSANVAYYKKQGSKNVFPTATQSIGNNLFSSNISLNLYF